MSGAPLGVFDSGLGGLSIAREIRVTLPHERLLYLADSAYCPYGRRPLGEIRARSLQIGRHLADQGVKALVVACNTASGAALEDLRSELTIPVIGVEPALKPATEASRNRRIGVLATAATLRTERYDRLMRRLASDVRVLARPGTGLVELVESGRTRGPEVERILRELLNPFSRAGIDTLVLGCTHYPFLREAFQAVLGPEVEILDSGAGVARRVADVLGELGIAEEAGDGDIRLLTTGDAESVSTVAARLWGSELSVEPLTLPGSRAAGDPT